MKSKSLHVFELFVKGAVGSLVCLRVCLLVEGWLETSMCCCKVNGGIQVVPSAQWCLG